MGRICHWLTLSWLAVLAILLPAANAGETSANTDNLVLGIFSYRPDEVVSANYQPLVDYLNQHLRHSHIHIESLDLQQIEAALDEGKLDFLLTNPSHYVYLRTTNELTGALATVTAINAGIPTSELGGVIITRAERADINLLADTQGKRIGFPGTRFLGGYQAQLYELKRMGISLPKETLMVELGSHDRVVDAVINNRVDIGFIRTGILESMSADGKLDIHQLKVLNERKVPRFPFLLSTDLYPEWPFVALPHVDKDEARLIASALLGLEPNHPAAKGANIAGFSLPVDYLPLENLSRELRLPPYDMPPQVSLVEFINQHRWPFALSAISVMVIVSLTWTLLLRNRQIAWQSRQLADSLSYRNALLSALPDYMFVLDRQGRYLYAHAPQTLDLDKNRDEVLGRMVQDVLPAEAAQQVLLSLHEARQHGRSSGQLIQLPTESGSQWFELSTSALRQQQQDDEFIVLSRNVSERKQTEDENLRLQRELDQAHKMEALGQLSGGIAHDFNNILGIIMGYTDMTLMKLGPNAPDQINEYLHQVLGATVRAKDLVNQILTYTRRTLEHAQPLQITPLVEAVAKMMHALLPSSIRIELDVGSSLPDVLMDSSKLHQILINLCINARDAMDGQGTLRLGVHWCPELHTECYACHAKVDGGWVELSVADTGCGMSEETLSHVFEPFFTTKEVGKGTGMGLAVVHAIVRSHGGHILVETQIGKGTSFKLLFPPYERHQALQ